MRHLHELELAARRRGRRLNVLATIRSPAGVPDAEGKRIIALAVAHLGQALHRRGQPHLGITVHEKEIGGLLHGHHLVHVPQRDADILDRWADGEVRHVRPSVSSDITYITKQRQALPPETEYRVRQRHSRRPGAEIPGRRWTVTAALRDCVSTQEERDQAGTGKFKKARTIRHLDKVIGGAGAAAPWALDDAGQFLLFGKASEIRLDNFWSGRVPPEVAADIEIRRKALGISKGELARRAGVSHPTLSNALAGRFGLSRQPVALLQAALAV